MARSATSGVPAHPRRPAIVLPINRSVTAFAAASAFLTLQLLSFTVDSPTTRLAAAFGGPTLEKTARQIAIPTRPMMNGP
jgi:hypothetical protein